MSIGNLVVTSVLLFCCLIMHSLSLRLSSQIRSRQGVFRLRRPLSVCSRDDVTIRNSLIATDGSGPTYTKLDISKPLSWYSCGPTVYDSSHLGHARTYVCTDIIRRILTNYFNANLNYAMGITDIDDKIIDKARSRQLHTWAEMEQMVRGLEDDFFHDMDRLNVLRPDTVLRVTEHIPEIIAYIARLVELKSAYVTADGVYFDFFSLSNTYDKFGCAHPGSEAAAVDNDSGAPIDPNAASYQASTKHLKRNAKDFALWKLHRGAGDSHDGRSCTWESPWGAGRPGWHIECSAMTHSLFGAHIDIHSGGIDLKFPHHTNEIAQCESHNCAEHNGWVGSWIHLGHLHIEGRKMSKSLKNFISIDDYLASKQTTHPGDDFRIYCLLHKYHSSLTYAPVRIQEAAKFRQKMEGFYSSVRAAIALYSSPASAASRTQHSATADSHSSVIGSNKVGVSRKPTAESTKLSALFRSLQSEVHAAMCDDFDTPKVLHCLSQLVGESALYVQLVMAEPAVDPSAALLRPQPIEPLLAISAYVTKILSTLGLRFPSALASQQYLSGSDGAHGANGGIPGDGAVIGTGGNGVALGDDTIDAIVQFRTHVRLAALQGTKALKAQKKAAGTLSPVETQLEQSLGQIMTSCDAGRDALGKALGVKIDDMGSTSKWTKL